MPTLRLSAIALILANFVPVFGVLYWGWSVGSIIALYWAENWVIGALNLPKMWMAKERSRRSSFPLSLFFAVHYGFFTAIHGVFVFSLFGEDMDVFDLLPGGGVISDFVDFGLQSHPVLYRQLLGRRGI